MATKQSISRLGLRIDRLAERLGKSGKPIWIVVGSEDEIDLRLAAIDPEQRKHVRVICTGVTRAASL